MASDSINQVAQALMAQQQPMMASETMIDPLLMQGGMGSMALMPEPAMLPGMGMQMAANEQENLRRLIANDKNVPIRKEIRLPPEQVLEELRRLIRDNS